MKVLLRVIPYLRPYKWLLISSGLLAIPLAALRASPVPLIKYFLDDLERSKDSRKLLVYPALFIGLYTINFIVRFLHYYLLRILVARVNQRIKNNLYDHLLGLSADYYTSQSVGTLISRVGHDPQVIDAGIYSINTLIREPVTFIFLFSYALYTDWKLTLVTLTILPLLAWVFSVTGKHLKRYIGKMQEENARLTSTLQESFSGIRVVKTFRLEKYTRKKFRERSEHYVHLQLKTAAMEEASHPMVELLTAFAIAVVIFYGGKRVMDGRMTPGGLLSFFAAFGLMMNQIRLLNDVSLKMHAAAAAATRIFEIFDWKTRLHESQNPIAIRSFESSIQFENVSFSYPDAPERKILKDISFEVKKGSIVASVGASGAGKSSLVSLLPRIFDVTGGSIQIDGRDIREYRLDDLRKMIAVVSQDVFLFNDSIEENIRCGRLAATSEEIREAARRAHAIEFIDRTQSGFQTIIGDRGQKLSGGEKQRLSIARAFLRESPILILDEATSSLDSHSERMVQSALDELMSNRTTLVIAHRLSTIQHADHIVVLKEGQIVESGKHEELLARKGEYARFQAFNLARG